MDWTQIIVALVGSIATITTVIIQARRTNSIMEVNDYKTYLLVLLGLHPEKADEIYSVAKKYFYELGGDSFLVPLFNDWLNVQGAATPEWFLTAKAKHPHNERSSK